MKNTKEYNARYYQKHKEKIREKKAQQYKDDPEKYKERARAWVDANRGYWNQYMRERRKKLKSIDKTK